MTSVPRSWTPARQEPRQGLAEKIRRAVPNNIPLEFGETKTDVDVRVKPEHLLEVVRVLKEHRDLAFDFLRNMAGVDMQEQGLHLKIHLYSFKHNHSVQITVECPPEEDHPHVPSLTSLYRAADWHEREAAEMFGFVFDGHPNLKNLLLEEDLHIHPLLKAHPLQEPEILQGIEEGPPGFPF